MRSFLMISVLFFLGMSPIWAQCGDGCKDECCQKVEKKCEADCQKACCAKEAKKACGPDCQKACCAKKACGPDCQKACCAKEAKKACGPDCQKACCNEEAKNAEMDKWIKLATPGQNHAYLAPLVGEWNATTTWYMDPTQPPHKSTATSKTHWILGGRYLIQEYSGTYMGMPFEGAGMTAYDNAKKQYEGIWVDSFGTGVYHSVGSCDEAGKVFTSSGEMLDPESGAMIKTRDVLTIIDANKHIFQMHMVIPSGEEMKIMEIVYTRK